MIAKEVFFKARRPTAKHLILSARARLQGQASQTRLR